MQTLRKIILVLLDSRPLKTIYKIILLYLFREKNIYYVTGLRRSGNHAFINWLTNSLENKQTDLIRDNSYRHFHETSNSETIFFNEVNKIPTVVFFRIIIKNSASIRSCSNVIISTEDCSAEYSSFKIPRYDKAIFVKRSLLNLIASRLKYLSKRANDGRSSYWNAIDDDVLSKLLSFYRSAKFYIWDFEQWLTSENYRKSFMSKLNLNTAPMPAVSKFGGGSSFTGTNENPNMSELINRYEQVEFSKKVISYLRNDRYRKLLNDQEIDFLLKEASVKANIEK